MSFRFSTRVRMAPGMTVERITELPELPPRPPGAHKGLFGKVAIVGGSRGMSGAVALAGLGALRGGAGLVFLAVPRSVLPIVAAVEPCYLTLSLPEDEEGRICMVATALLQNALPGHDAAAVGPGLGRSEELTGLLQRVYTEATVPLVIDADGLNALAEVSRIDSSVLTGFLPERTGEAAEAGRLFPRILTPHPGEFARLIGSEAATVQSRREELAVRYAAQNNVVLVLKGHRTLVTDGQRVYENTTGNSGMATGGSGDVLTGLITALLGQKLPAFEAAQLGVHLHGLAGDLAAVELSQPGLIASDLPRFLPAAWQRLYNV